MERRISDCDMIRELVPNSKGIELVPADIILQSRTLLERLYRCGIHLPSCITYDTTPGAPMGSDVPEVDEISFDYSGATLGIWRQKGDLVLHWTDGHVERYFNLPTDMNVALSYIGDWCDNHGLCTASRRSSIPDPNFDHHFQDSIDPDRKRLLELVRDCERLDEIPHDMVVQTRIFLDMLAECDIRLPTHLGVDTSVGSEIVDEVSFDWPGATMGIWRNENSFTLHWTDGKVEKKFILPTDRKIAVDWVGRWCKDCGLFFESF